MKTRHSKPPRPEIPHPCAVVHPVTFDPVLVFAVVLALAAIVAFILWELHTDHPIPMPLLYGDTNRIRQREHLVRPKSDRAIRRNPAQLLMNGRDRNARAQRE